MSKKSEEKFISDISKKEFPISEKIYARNIRKSVYDLIKKEIPDFNSTCILSTSDLNIYRKKYIELHLTGELGQMTELEKNVVQNIDEDTTLTDKLEEQEKNQKNTFSQRIADNMAAFGGSWTFILSFLGIIFIWIASNVYILHNKGFDPYPFILLNLVLSCLAAFQAPVIMMSQNRQEEKDRERSRNDYMINLKAELEIRILHEKIDQLIIHQQQELAEMQKIQIEMLNELIEKSKNQ